MSPVIRCSRQGRTSAVRRSAAINRGWVRPGSSLHERRSLVRRYQPGWVRLLVGVYRPGPVRSPGLVRPRSQRSRAGGRRGERRQRLHDRAGVAICCMWWCGPRGDATRQAGGGASDGDRSGCPSGLRCTRAHSPGRIPGQPAPTCPSIPYFVAGSSDCRDYHVTNKGRSLTRRARLPQSGYAAAGGRRGLQDTGRDE